MHELFSFRINELKCLDEKYETQSDCLIQGVSSINNLRSNTLLFVNRLRAEGLDKLQKVSRCVILANKRQKTELECLNEKHVVFFVTNPRLEYAKMLQFILKQTTVYPAERCLAMHVGDNFKLGENAFIASRVIIGNNVIIGNSCSIKAGAIINDNVQIGDGTVIREHAVIRHFEPI